jgi:hypothetical protein
MRGDSQKYVLRALPISQDLRSDWNHPNPRRRPKHGRRQDLAWFLTRWPPYSWGRNACIHQAGGRGDGQASPEPPRSQPVPGTCPTWCPTDHPASPSRHWHPRPDSTRSATRSTRRRALKARYTQRTRRSAEIAVRQRLTLSRPDAAAMTLAALAVHAEPNGYWKVVWSRGFTG